MRFDLHIHTTLSKCSQLDLEEMLTAAGSKGLDGVCITDHDTMAVRHHLEEGIQANGLCVIFGMEYATTEGDFLIFGPFEEIATGLPASKLLNQVERAGGVAVAAHPFRVKRPTQEYLVSQGLCRIVEGVNGRNQGTENAATSAWQDQYGVAMVGGSDAHSIAELGRVTTSFTAPIRSRDDLIGALKTGAFTPQHPDSPSQ
ncbi:MAG: PHP domain-containing protein [Desulfobulbaceae bacterium]|jgi:predicted metal-dependent phosphoesterase TrpH|nr:PHP domain-containing protein [Desulfobulbaceae bacterium]